MWDNWGVKKYWANFSASYHRNFTYRVAVIIRTARDITMPAFFILLWSALFRNNSAIGGYTFKDIVAYYILVRIFDRFYTFYPARILNRNIRNGDLSNFLIKPIKYPLVLAFLTLGQRVSETTFTLIIVSVLFLFFPNIVSYPPNWFQTALFIIFAILSWVMFYEMALLFGMISFWTTEVGNLRSAVDQLILLLGGLWIPLNLFPAGVEKILNYFPFKYLFYFLVQVYQGKLESDVLVNNFIIELSWIILFGIVINILWKAGVKKYENFGR